MCGTVYFAQGFKALGSLAISSLLKDILGLSPAASQAFVSTAFLPWALKPIYGLLSDFVPLWGKRRQSYVFLSGILGVLACLGLCGLSYLATTDLAAAEYTFGGAQRFRMAVLAGYFLINLCTALSDVVVDAMVAERTKAKAADNNSKDNDSDDEQLQSFCWSCMGLGGIAGSILGGVSFSRLGISGVLFLNACCPLLVSFAALLITEEEQQDQGKSSKTAAAAAASDAKGSARIWKEIRLLVRTARRPYIWQPMLYIFLRGAIAPNLGHPMYYYVTEELGLTTEFLSAGTSLMWIMMLVGTVISKRIYHQGKSSYAASFWWGQFALTICNIFSLALVFRVHTMLGIPDAVFILGTDAIETIISHIVLLPFLNMAAQLTPPGIEATLFALFMSVSNFSGQIGSYSGALLTNALGIGVGNYEHLGLALLIRTGLMIVPLALVSKLVPDTVDSATIHNTSSSAEKEE